MIKIVRGAILTTREGEVVGFARTQDVNRTVTELRSQGIFITGRQFGDFSRRQLQGLSPISTAAGRRTQLQTQTRTDQISVQASPVSTITPTPTEQALRQSLPADLRQRPVQEVLERRSIQEIQPVTQRRRLATGIGVARAEEELQVFGEVQPAPLVTTREVSFGPFGVPRVSEPRTTPRRRPFGERVQEFVRSPSGFLQARGVLRRGPAGRTRLTPRGEEVVGSTIGAGAFSITPAAPAIGFLSGAVAFQGIESFQRPFRTEVQRRLATGQRVSIRERVSARPEIPFLFSGPAASGLRAGIRAAPRISLRTSPIRDVQPSLTAEVQTGRVGPIRTTQFESRIFGDELRLRGPGATRRLGERGTLGIREFNVFREGQEVASGRLISVGLRTGEKTQRQFSLGLITQPGRRTELFGSLGDTREILRIEQGGRRLFAFEQVGVSALRGRARRGFTEQQGLGTFSEPITEPAPPIEGSGGQQILIQRPQGRVRQAPIVPISQTTTSQIFRSVQATRQTGGPLISGKLFPTTEVTPTRIETDIISPQRLRQETALIPDQLQIPTQRQLQAPRQIQRQRLDLVPIQTQVQPQAIIQIPSQTQIQRQPQVQVPIQAIIQPPVQEEALGQIVAPAPPIIPARGRGAGRIQPFGFPPFFPLPGLARERRRGVTLGAGPDIIRTPSLAGLESFFAFGTTEKVPRGLEAPFVKFVPDIFAPKKKKAKKKKGKKK